MKYRLLAVLLLTLFCTMPARAERPEAPRLLPKDTFVYVRIANVPDLVEKFQQTSLGQIFQDEQIRPLISDLYERGATAFEAVEDQVGASLGELLAIPQGELCLAVVAPEDGRPQVVGLIDVGERMEAAERVLERLEAALQNSGGTPEAETLDDTSVVAFTWPNRSRQFVIAKREQTFLFSSDLELVKQTLQVWNGAEAETLASNRRFTTIMKRSAGFKDERPQLTWYADPIGLARRALRGNLGAQAGLAMVSGLGLDGVKALGGSMIWATDDFDGIMHFHLSLQNPREGVVKMLALKSGDHTPEPWVPKDAVSYSTLHWDVETTHTELKKLYDTLTGENAWQSQIVDRVSGRLDVNLEADLIEALEGRLTMVTWMEPPARLNSQSTLVGAKLKDAEEFEQVLEHVVEQFSNRVTPKTYSGTRYYQAVLGEQPENFDELIARRPEPAFGIVGDYFLISDSTKFLQQAILAKKKAESLADDLEFKLISNKIDRQLGDSEAAMIAFSRPEEVLRTFYELGTSQTVRDRLAAAADGNRFFRELHEALSNNQLPPFSVLAKYLAPAGGMLTDDDTGIHYTAFGLRRE